MDKYPCCLAQRAVRLVSSHYRCILYELNCVSSTFFSALENLVLNNRKNKGTKSKRKIDNKIHDTKRRIKDNIELIRTARNRGERKSMVDDLATGRDLSTP